MRDRQGASYCSKNNVTEDSEHQPVAYIKMSLGPDGGQGQEETQVTDNNVRVGDFEMSF